MKKRFFAIVMLLLLAPATLIGCEMEELEPNEVSTSDYIAEYVDGMVILSSNLGISPYAPVTELVFAREGSSIVLKQLNEAFHSTDYISGISTVKRFEVCGEGVRITELVYNAEGRTQGEQPVNFVYDYFILSSTPNIVVTDTVEIEYTYSRIVSLSPRELEDCTVQRVIKLSKFSAFNKL